MAAYKYLQPLRPNREGRHWIRIFEVFPGYGDAPLSGQLLYVRLGAEPYEALSYHWGDHEAKVPIRCDDGILEITENLHTFLRCVRRRKQRRRVWVDAICINQSDLEERNFQVGIMWAIFAKAQQVIAWIGEHSELEDSKRAMAVIPILADVSETARVNPDTGEEGEPNKELEATLLQEHGVTESSLNAVARLLERPWFRRIWVVQEVAVSAQALVVCGTSTVSWTSFVLAALHVLGHRDVDHAGLSPFLKPIFDIELARHSFIRDENHDLLTLLFRFRKFHATDPRDKVYALLGLLDPRVLQHLDLYPDYKLSTAEVFKQVAGKVLSTSPNLDIICCLGTYDVMPDPEEEEKDEQPSWAPDWSVSNDLVPLTARIRPKEYLHNYRASKNTAASLMFIEEGDVLCLTGILVDKIQMAGMTMIYDKSQNGQGTDPSGADTAQNVIHFNWEKVFQVKAKKRYLTGEAMVDAYYQTLVADSYFATASTRAQFDQWDDFAQQFRWIYEGGYDKIPVISFFAVLMVWLMLFVRNFRYATNPDYPLPKDLAAKMVKATSRRRMIRTRNGYLGLGPERTQKGDFIGIFKGGRVPLVIRSDGPYWKVIGECYIHGMMQGEAWNEKLCGTMRFR